MAFVRRHELTIRRILGQGTSDELMGHPNELEVEAVRCRPIGLFHTFMHGAFTQDGCGDIKATVERRPVG
ncbi:hypothetical protein Shel_25480 [Slackia heliotrinireducens DSM 20476]|uniref:Uncharacterized protein n=1 Tax=Slackia heliotrinireducens (strain ATCC 29202 / DSM 20476 / NCTC 11029 / RHS 1) TaxID=471855 RepID=C7N2P7_SLAHD|nr:hypothetical protein Shel_25480 [Slackia heliotrinireducens DSM 20476]